jgi:plastocyanin
VAVLVGLFLMAPARMAGAETAEVTIAEMTFAPSTVRVEAVEGEAGLPSLHAHVEFSMRDPGVFHTVTFDEPGVVAASGPLAAGQRYDAVISKTGTFSYRCEIHPNMRGTVVVVKAPTSPPSAEDESSTSSPLLTILVVATVLAGVVGGLAVWRRRRTP